MNDFENRLRKNARHRFRWATRQGLTAFRLYDLDIPEWPFAVDWYAGWAHVTEFPRSRAVRSGRLEEARAQVLEACAAALELPPERIVTKTHEPKPWGRAQYEGRRAGGSVRTVVTVQEGGLSFECNLTEYLDTGLFLDHRPLRARVRTEAQGRRFLNLFAYTGAFTVHALAGGAAATTTVDLSNTYCDWAVRNLRLNGFDEGPRHRIVRADVLAWLETAGGPFDLVVLDPPTHSTSKKMEQSFNVQRDHPRLLDRVRGLLAPGGTLYFSTNYQGFELDPSVQGAEELRTVPEDFRRAVHRSWRITG